jgi:serine/threonine-protein kinase
MGVVFQALHEQLGQRVAIKLLRPESAHNPEHVGRFSREARAAARIRSDHVGKVLDIATSDGVPVIVMEQLVRP